MKISISGLKNLSESNLFLRAFWAELRLQFGKCAWHYQPFKDGPKQTIFLGFADIGRNRSLSVSLKYSQRTVISEIQFNEIFANEKIDENSDLAKKLQQAVDTALNRRANLSFFNLQIIVEGLRLPIAPYSGKSFNTSVGDGAFFDITLRVPGYDTVDVKAEAQRRIQYILDIASVETNHIFMVSSKKHSNISNTRRKSVAPLYTVNLFTSDEEWIDDVPVANGALLLSKSGKDIIDHIISAPELNDSLETFLRACHHFHMARQQDAILNDRLIHLGTKQVSSDEAVMSFKEDHRVISASRFALRSQELATVLYMSAVEVASLIGAETPKQCSKCGQDIYKIASRVIDLINRLTPQPDNDYIKNLFMDHYTKRSKYLHTGMLLADDNYLGEIIPMLNPINKSGVTQHSTVLVINVRECVGYILRQILKSLL